MGIYRAFTRTSPDIRQPAGTEVAVTHVSGFRHTAEALGDFQGIADPGIADK
jgi:hypothetical protein